MNGSKGIIKKLGMAVCVIAIVASSTLWLYSHHKSANPAPITTAATTIAPATTPVTTDNWQSYQIKNGDTLASIFAQYKLPQTSLLAVEKLRSLHLRNLHPGDTLNFLIKQNNLISLKYDLDARRYALITLSNDIAHLSIIDKPITSNLLFKSAVIAYSLQSAAYQAGLTKTMSAELREIFQNHANPALTAHKNDHIEILYREYYIDGKKYKPGDIVAAELIHDNKKQLVLRYQDPVNSDGYYTANGRSIDPLFLPYPVQFKRISSRFTHHRLDPYLHAWRAHLGVDFAADRGTPIRSIGNGRIDFIGRDGGYGNAVKVHYGRYYEALYGHMSRFAKALHNNEYVKKGEIIGYVGSTGWATGPHLHFSFFVDGVPEDWLSLPLPRADGISNHYLSAFEATERELARTLQQDEPKPTKVAQNTNTKNVK